MNPTIATDCPPDSAAGLPSQIPLIAPNLGGNEWTYVKDCLDTGWVSSAGSYVDRFESRLAERVETPHAVATVNGTAALHTALLVSGVQPGDAVLVSTLTFVAPANAIRYAGALPVFVDAEPRYWQMDVERLVRFLEQECAWRDGGLREPWTGKRIRAILPVHILGHPVDLDPLLTVAHRYNLSVIEDATECLGAAYRGRPVGSLGDCGCFSFNGNKIITTGGGGMLVSQRADYAARARYLTTQAKDDPFEYVHGAVGYNYRLTNVQAAIGVAQLERLDQFVAAKRRIAQRYRDALEGTPGIGFAEEAPWARSSFWMYTITLDERVIEGGSRRVSRDLQKAGIQTRPLWQPLHLSPAHAGAPRIGGEVSERLYRQALSLPCSTGLASPGQAHVIEALRKAVTSR